MVKYLSIILLLLLGNNVLASSGGIVHIDYTDKCNFVVTNTSIPKGSEIRLRAASDGQPIGFISIGLYSDRVKGIMAGGKTGKIIPVKNITSYEVFKLPIIEGGKYGLFLTKDGKSCDNNVSIQSMGNHDRVSFSGYPIDIKIYVPEF